MIDVINKYTLEYIDSISKESRKKIGQFFTQPKIAEFMGSLMKTNQKNIRILDCGAGSGILTASICEKCLKNSNIENIHIDLYENNGDILPVLKKSLSYIESVMKEYNKNFTYNIIEKNFILYNADFWNEKQVKHASELYDVVISNPPYKKISKSDEEAVTMSDIVHGQPNIYFLFIAMATKLLKNEGEMIFINPRSFTSGAYFKKFRKYLFSYAKFTDIHLFGSRNKVFNKDKVLQETIIFRAIKSKNQVKDISITTSSDFSFSDNNEIVVNSNLIVDTKSEHLYVFLPTSKEEVEIINLINSWKYTISELGFKFSTGKVVDFRAKEFIKFEDEEKCVPLIWSCNFKKNRIIHPVDNQKNKQFILDTINTSSLMVENKDYILVKRFTSKEEHKRIQCALYFADEFKKFDNLGIENHLNYIYKQNDNIEKEEMYGLFAILNSTYFDMYYRILNGSTQVNASEFNSIKLPDIDTIKQIGNIFINQDTSVENCDKLIEDFFLNNILETRIG